MTSMWGALGKLVEGMLTSDPEKIREALTDGEPRKTGENFAGEVPTTVPPDQRKKMRDQGCGAVDKDGYVCFGHKGDGTCVHRLLDAVGEAKERVKEEPATIDVKGELVP